MLTADRQINQKLGVSNFLSPNLVFIDSQIEDYQFLVSGIYEGISVIIIPQNQDGIEVITTHLEQYTNSRQKLDAIHIFSHGSPGSLKLGNISLELNNIDRYRHYLKQWQNSLNSSSEILLYGCNVAAGIGESFVRKLHQLTQANIAASVNLTGAYPGDWNLEFTTGKITASKVLKPEIMATYNGTLDTLTVTNNNDSGAGSLRQAIADAESGDTIVFDSSLANQTITLTSSQLEIINKDLTIDAVDAPGLSISGNNTHRVLETSFQTNVTLRNLTIANGSTTESGVDGRGGGIKTASETTLTVENSTFKNNIISGTGGGAISAGHKSNTTIINSKFDNNDATAGESERGGGAINTNGFAVLTIQDSEFTNNKGVNGGAINAPSTALTVENSRFINNDTTAVADIPSTSSSPLGFGGAIYTDGVSASFDGDNGTIAIRNSHFEGNKGAGAGGAAFLFIYPGDDVVIENTNIINNSVIEDTINISSGGETRQMSQGGGIRIGTGESSIGRTSPGRFTISNSTFVGNTSEIEGGGLWIDRKLDLTRVDIVNSTFSENRAESANGTVGLGGAITAYAPTNITNTTITNNFAGEEAGAIYTNPSPDFTPNIQVKNTIFDRNSAGNVNDSQQSNIQLIDQGGNLQYPAVGGDDELVTANIAIGDPNLADLQEVNGFLVHPLEDGSAAIDAGVNTNTPNTDQLGNTRPVDGDNNGSSITDIGAVEFIPTSPPENCITGDSSDNSINGTSDNDCIDGLGGNDILKGAAGDDTINGGDDNDTLGGGADNDQLNGDAGNDSLTGWRGNDIIDGGDGFDTLQGGDDADTLKGGIGNDLLNGGNGDDFIEGEAGDDELNGGDGQDTLGGGNGQDIINGNAGNDSLTGWLGDDIINGGNGFDTLQGGDDADTLNGGNDADTLKGGTGNDQLNGGSGDDFIEGEAGDDELNGGDGQDTLGGGNGNDIIKGNAGNDFLTGWLGDDIINGGNGFDTLQGGDDADTLNGGNDADTLKGGSGNDQLNGDNGDDFIEGQANDDELNGGDGQDTLGGGNGQDIINGNAGNDSLTGWLGDDTLTGGTGNDILQGGDGLDILNGEQGTDTLIGGSNSDRFKFDLGTQFNLTDIGSDIITDFNSAESDKIVLDKTTFTSLASVVGDGFSVAGEFAVVNSDAVAATSSAKIVYNSTNGQLFYNPNGATSGFGDGGLFATLENQANLQAEDFVLTSNSTPEPTPATPAEITSSVINFTPSNTEAEIAAKGGPSIEIGTQTIYIGTWQESSNNQDPIIASFDDTNPANNWVRTDYESTGADGRGRGLFWDGDDLYAVFSTDGTQGSPSQDFRRAASDATQSWLRSYGQGGTRKVSVVARIDEVTGEMTDAAFLSAVLNSGDSNTLTVTDLSINSDNNLVVEADAFFGPRNPDGSRMTQVVSGGSPFDYTVEITQSLDEVISTAAVGWE